MKTQYTLFYKNKLRTIPASELMAQGKYKNNELHHVFSMFIKNKIKNIKRLNIKY